jgi:hypothetical protein
MKKGDKVHGEGNYKAAKEFDDAQKAFVQSGRVDEAARQAAPKSKAEAEELIRAEELARSRSKDRKPSAPGSTPESRRKK